MGILFVDPQGQFSSGRGLPFDLQEKLKQIDRRVEVYRLSKEVRLQPNLPLFTKLLSKTGFYRKIGVSAAANQGYAQEELQRIIASELEARNKSKLDNPGNDFFHAVIQRFATNTNAIGNIYAAQESRQRLTRKLQDLLADSNELREFENECWTPVLDLFLATDSRGNHRTSLWAIIAKVIGADVAQRPVIFLDISGSGTSLGEDDDIKALILNEITHTLSVQGEKVFLAGGKVK